jgi:hypothetical protein
MLIVTMPITIILLNVANNPFMLSVVMLNVVMLSVVMLSVVMLNVVAPFCYSLARHRIFLHITLPIFVEIVLLN